MIFGRSKKKRVAEVIATNNIHDHYGDLQRRFATPFAEGFVGKNKESGSSEILWILRIPITPLSPEAASYTRAMSKACSLDVDYVPLIGYGVDARGIAFFVSEDFDGRVLGTAPVRANEVQTLFEQCVHTLAGYHRSGLCLGGVSEDTFMLAGARVYLQGMVPYMPLFSTMLERKVELRFLNFLAPEQRLERESSARSDVYALGVYLFRLISGEWPPVYQVQSQHAEYLRQYMPSFLSRNPDVPAWVGPVIEKCLQWEPALRYQDANELSELLKDARTLHGIGVDEVKEYASKTEEILASVSSVRPGDFFSPMMLVTFIFIGIALFLVAPGSEKQAEDEFSTVAAVVGETGKKIPSNLAGGRTKNVPSTEEISSIVAERRIESSEMPEAQERRGTKAGQSSGTRVAASQSRTSGTVEAKSGILAEGPEKNTSVAALRAVDVEEPRGPMTEKELIREYLEAQGDSLELKTWFER